MNMRLQALYVSGVHVPLESGRSDLDLNPCFVLYELCHLGKCLQLSKIQLLHL